MLSGLLIRAGPGDLWLLPPYLSDDLLPEPETGSDRPYPGTDSLFKLVLMPAAERADDKLWLTSLTAPGAREGEALKESSLLPVNLSVNNDSKK